MSGWQIAALVFAIILLLPGGCFLFFGAAILPPLLLVAAIILGLAGWLFWFALSRPPSAAAGEPLPPPDLTSFPLTAERARRELRLRNYGVKRFLFASRLDVRLPSGATRNFRDEAAFLEWARRELG